MSLILFVFSILLRLEAVLTLNETESIDYNLIIKSDNNNNS